MHAIQMEKPPALCRLMTPVEQLGGVAAEQMRLEEEEEMEEEVEEETEEEMYQLALAGASKGPAADAAAAGPAQMSAVNVFPAKGLSSRYSTDSAVSIWTSARLACMQPSKTGEGRGEGRGKGKEVVYACDRGCGFKGDYDTVEKHEQVCDQTMDARKSLPSVMRRFCMLACSMQCVLSAAQ
jgi:hypothetical protein